jgi:hypothetical protein
MKISNFKDFKLTKSSSATIIGAGCTWQKTYANNDPEQTTYWQDCVDNVE